MEEYVVALQLQHNRAQLRALLLPAIAGRRNEVEAFPRSAFMRFLLDPGKRSLAVTAINSLLKLKGQWKRNPRH